MNVKARLYFRTLRFLAFYWGLPFFFGIGTALAIVTYAELSLLEVLGDAFDQSFEAVIQSCAL